MEQAIAPNGRPYVFGVGLSKTGTHSLNAALEMLGWPSIHYPDPALMLAGRFGEALAGRSAGTDISVSALYRELDRAYPGSLFVLTVREASGWIESVEDHRRRRAHEDVTACPKAAVREIVYGTRGFDRDLFLASLEEHERGVRGYFAGAPGRLLVVDQVAQPRWEPLCGFLGVAAPGAGYPHRNARAAA